MARGGKREGSGRPRGSRSAATKDQIANISEMAKMHSADALEALHLIATQGESEAARVSAANSILDRAFGKPQQAIDHSSTDGTMSPIVGFTLEVMDEAALPSDEAATGLPN